MAEIVVYITQRDADEIRNWINSESCIAWIVKERESKAEYHWKARETLDTIGPQDYCLWHKESGSLNVPSGRVDIPDVIVEDPFEGWTQHLDEAGATVPWFGDNLPGPYLFRFREDGREAPRSLARSGFFWPGDYFRPVGKPASLESKRWWTRLGRYVRAHSTGIPWPPDGNGRRLAYAFPDAFAQILAGRRIDVNP